MAEESWHLDKKVPISLIVLILVQTSAFIWWAATMDTRVTQLEASRANASQQEDLLQIQANQVNTRLSNLETRFNYFETAQSEMKSDIRALLDKSRE